MQKLKHYFKTQWESIFCTAVWIPTIFMAIASGSVVFGISSFVFGAMAFLGIYSLIEKYEKLQQEKSEKAQQTFGGPASGIPRRGVIFTVGRQVETIAYSVNGLKPEYVGFICTAETVNVIKNSECASGYNEDNAKYEIVNPADIEDIRIKAKLIIDWMIGKGLASKDIALDPTGGLTSMSLGAYAATYERQIDSQYVRSSYDENNKPIPGTQQLTLLAHYTEAG